MAGSNSKREMLTEGPIVILVEPQLGENIGMVARAMANFGLSELRLVAPRDGWPPLWHYLSELAVQRKREKRVRRTGFAQKKRHINKRKRN